jgi:hypothetical protein
MSDRHESGGSPDADQIRGWAGYALDDLRGTPVGSVEGPFGDAVPGSVWLLARMGRFGHRTLVPARDAVEGVERIWVPYTRARIRAAARIEPGDDLGPEVERGYLEHYGIIFAKT